MSVGVCQQFTEMQQQVQNQEDETVGKVQSILPSSSQQTLSNIPVVVENFFAVDVGHHDQSDQLKQQQAKQEANQEKDEKLNQEKDEKVESMFGLGIGLLPSFFRLSLASNSIPDDAEPADAAEPSSDGGSVKNMTKRSDISSAPIPLPLPNISLIDGPKTGPSIRHDDGNQQPSTRVETINSLQVQSSPLDMPSSSPPSLYSSPSFISLSNNGASTSSEANRILFLEQKINLLELLLKAKNEKISTQQADLATLRKRVALMENKKISLVEDDDQEDQKVDAIDQERQDDMKKATSDLEASRLTAASFIHAEGLYINKILQLEKEIAEMRAQKNEAVLFSITNTCTRLELEQTLFHIQRVLDLDPNISFIGLEQTKDALGDLVEKSKSIISNQSQSLKSALQENQNNKTGLYSGTKYLMKALLSAVESLDMPFKTSVHGMNLLELSTRLSASIQGDLHYLKTTCTRLEDQLAMNLEIKKLLVSSQIERKKADMLVKLNDVMKENCDLKHQLALHSSSRSVH